MSRRALRPTNVGAAALVIGGLLVIAWPQHAMSVARLVIVTCAFAAGLYALAVHVPPTGWISPFKWMSPFRKEVHETRTAHRADEVTLIRGLMSGRRQRLRDGSVMPASALRLLQPLITAALDLGPDDPVDSPSVRRAVSPLTYAVLTTPPLHRPPWYRTRRPNPRAVATQVQSVLDDLSRLRGGVVQPRTASTSPARTPR